MTAIQDVDDCGEKTGAGEITTNHPPDAIRPPRIWKSCCLTADPDAVKYILTYAMSASIIAFSFFRLSSTDDELALCVSVISGIMGTYLPSPLTHRDRPQNP